LTANGIKTYLFDDIRPTPELSFAVRIIGGASAGIVITASHNPPDYNGYKVYGENGAQILPEVANQIIAEIAKIKDFSEVKLISLKEAKERGLLQLIGGALDRVYYEKVKNLSLSNDVDKELNIVYTPLHGTGNIPIRTILADMGFKNIFVVEEQSRPDPEFSTVTSPNPENPEAFKLALQLGERVKADILIATDPDADRLAVCVLANDQYIFLNGNQTGALLLDYILARRKERGKLPQNGFVIKTIVTSEMGRVISNSYSIPTYDTLTGFKYICNKAEDLEKEGGVFLFGYEESIGYLTGNFVRDKDAVISALLVSEMAAYYKKRGLTLLAVLEELYERYGYFLEHLESIYLEGLEGEEQMQKIMSAFREEFPEIPGMPVSRKIDYKTSFQYDYEHHKKESIDIPQSDVLKCIFTDGCWYAIRPSGTEPKIKIYFSMVGKDRRETEAKLEKVKSAVLRKVNVNGVNS
jgi:phosphoglucomutase